MLSGFIETSVLFVISAMCSIIATPAPCHQQLFVEQSQHVFLDVVNKTMLLTGEHQACVVELATHPSLLLVVNLTYSPHPIIRGDNCTLDYVHVGNDNSAIGREMVTSYKFCQQVQGIEVVSRYNYLWVVVKFSFPPLHLQIDVTAQPKVECDAADMQCSPVQCVSRDSICDGRADCRNGADEYCLRLKEVDAPLEGDTCFRCGDGTCVLPKAPRYSEQWEIPLWFLCDGVKHCLDGWDERKDVCYRRQGRRAAVFECVPSDLPLNVNTSALLWTVLKCDDHQDCRDWEDETGCKNSAAGLSEQLHFDPLTACLIAALLITVCGGFLFITRRVRQKASQVTREKKSSEDASCGDNYNDRLAAPKRAEVVWLRSQVIEDEQDTPHVDITLTTV